MNSSPEQPASTYVVSHRRSGTHLTLDNLVANFDCFRDGFANFDKTPQSDKRLFKTHVHASNGIEAIPGPANIIYVVRDGKDVMVSMYYYLKKQAEQFPEFGNLSFNDFLKSKNHFDGDTIAGKMGRVEFWNHHVNSWLDQERFELTVVTFDQWRLEFDKTIQRVSDFLKEPVKSGVTSMVRSKKETLFSRLLKKAGLSKHTSIDFRGGRSGDWQEHFDDESLAYFDSLTEDTYKRLDRVSGQPGDESR